MSGSMIVDPYVLVNKEPVNVTSLVAADEGGQANTILPYRGTKKDLLPISTPMLPWNPRTGCLLTENPDRLSLAVKVA